MFFFFSRDMCQRRAQIFQVSWNIFAYLHATYISNQYVFSFIGYSNARKKFIERPVHYVSFRYEFFYRSGIEFSVEVLFTVGD